jgi:apolipoprotein N-acyltransferase
VKLSRIKKYLPSRQSAGLAVLSAILLILAFPGFELAWVAWISFIPLLAAVDREKGSAARALVTGWIFGTCFFFGTCWWLTYSPIVYAGFPVPLAYFLLLCVCLIVGIFPAFFALILSVLLRRLGTFAMFFAPFIWIATEFLRFWVTGNNWNAVAYSQAFGGGVLQYARFGGIYLVGFIVLMFQTLAVLITLHHRDLLKNEKAAPSYLVGPFAIFGWLPFLNRAVREKGREIDAQGGVSQRAALFYVAALLILPFAGGVINNLSIQPAAKRPYDGASASIVAIQPNVPMSGLDGPRYEELKRKHLVWAEGAFESNLPKLVDEKLASEPESPRDESWRRTWAEVFTKRFQKQPKIVIFPESPMNFMYEDDKDFQEFVRAFAIKNNTSVLFNAAEPDPANKKYFNSAVMVDASGNKVAQYDKIYLVPFGETVPAPLQSIIPALVGSFSYGKEYDLLPFGDAKGGIMICFESHFPNLSREYTNEGADVLIEMTNDGYLGPTPVLRQHLANAVFRAVETRRPLLRITNVGISAYINENGDVLGPTESYTEDTRVWSVAKSDGSRTFYVRFGDWFAWLCSVVTLILLVFAMFKRRSLAENKAAHI